MINPFTKDPKIKAPTKTKMFLTRAFIFKSFFKGIKICL
ncbi:MAG: hypothetical protein RLY64_489 [Bacteroidota bacterium]